MTSPQVTQQREMPADGQTYIVGQGGGARAGDADASRSAGCRIARCGRATWRCARGRVILAARRLGRTRGARSAVDPRAGDLQRPPRPAVLGAGGARRAAAEGRSTTACMLRVAAALVTALEGIYAGLDREAGSMTSTSRDAPWISRRCTLVEVTPHVRPPPRAATASRSASRRADHRAARPQRRRQVDAAVDRRDAADAVERHRSSTATHDARGGARRCAARIGLLGHDLYIYPELTRRRTCGSSRRLYGLPTSSGGSTPR